MRARRRATYAATALLWGAGAWFALQPAWVDVRLFALTATAAVCATIGVTVRGLLDDLYRRTAGNRAAIEAVAEGLRMTLESAQVPPPPAGPGLHAVGGH